MPTVRCLCEEVVIRSMENSNYSCMFQENVKKHGSMYGKIYGKVKKPTLGEEP